MGSTVDLLVPHACTVSAKTMQLIDVVRHARVLRVNGPMAGTARVAGDQRSIRRTSVAGDPSCTAGHEVTFRSTRGTESRALIRSIVRVASCFALFAIGSGGAEAGSSSCDDLRGGDINFQVDWQTQIKPILNNALGGRCTGCHFGSRFPDMTDTGIDAIYKLVNSYALPGRPRQSGLFDKVNCNSPGNGVRMPMDGTPLTLGQQALIYDWIAQGATGEDPAQPIQRGFIFRDGVESQRWY
jgi:hypothetical protein